MIQRFASRSLLLHPHRDTETLPGAPLQAVSAAGEIDSSGWLAATFELRGDLTQVQLPVRAPADQAPPARRNGLWHHTCLEIFLRAGEAASYLEFNFSPNGDWAAYSFDGYRSAQRDLEMSAARVLLQPHDQALQIRLSAAVPALARVKPALWRVNFAAIVEDRAGSRYYWALQHPRARPDFHDPASFVASADTPD